MDFGVPGGSPIFCRQLGGAPSGIQVKLHVAPLGDALAWVSARFAISETCEAV